MLFDLKHTQEVPTKTFYDNKSTITLTNKLIFHGRNKHVDIKFHYICDWWKKIMVEFYSFENQIAIIFMKPIKVRTLLKVKKMVGIIMKYEELSLKEAMKESKLSKNYISLVY